MRRSDREIKEMDTIFGILKKAEVCHLALSDGGQPYLVALNYGIDYTTPLTVYFHCAPEGRKIDIIKKNNSACFMVETDLELKSGPKGCDWGMNFCSVVAFGTIEIIQEAREKLHGLDLIMAQYSTKKGFDYDEKIVSGTIVLKLTIGEITAKRKKN
jgi:uncharacterized protein